MTCSITNKTSVWSSHALCGYEIGGICNMSTFECDCKDGFSHDLLGLRQRDCSAFKVFYHVFFSCAISFTLAVLIYNLINLNGSTGIARIILQLSSTSLFFFAVFMGCIVVSSYEYDGVVMITYEISIIFWILGIYVCLYSMTSPLYKMAGKSDQHLISVMKICYFIFRLFHIFIFILMISMFEDPSNPDNDYGWNILFLTLIQLYGVESLCLFVMYRIFGNKMIHQIEGLIEKTPDNPNHTTTRQYLYKLKNFHRFLSIISPIPLLFELSVPIIKLSTGYIPFIYIFILGWLVTLPCINIALIRYSIRRSIKEPKISNINNQVMKKQDKNENEIKNNENNLSAENSKEILPNCITFHADESKHLSSLVNKSV